MLNNQVNTKNFAALGVLALATLNTTIPAFAQEERVLPQPSVTVTTVPVNGDVNPYGVAFVPSGFPKTGLIQSGDLLVSNFNNSKNLQGTGTTIIRIDSKGKQSTFFQGQPGLGLSTALNVMRQGLVFVGDMPTKDGTCATADRGAMLILDSNAKVLASLSGPAINGPWDSTLFDAGDFAHLFVANALSGTIVRFDLILAGGSLSLRSVTQIASGYVHRCDPNALVVAPTGLVYDVETDTLYVASSGDNAIFAVANAGSTGSDNGMGSVVFNDQNHLHGALAMTMAPNGHLLVTNNDVVNGDENQPSEIVEFTKDGQFVGQLPVDPAQGGSFGLAFDQPKNGFVRFAAVNDNQNTITIWTLPTSR